MSETPLIGDFSPAPDAGLSGARIGVITFPGTLDDADAARAVRLAGGTAVSLWHGDHDLQGVDAVILPGGFSYGDYLRAGAISRFAPVMEQVVDGAKGGLPVLGICNGFQVLTEAHLLPGSMIKNNHLHFVCRDQKLRVENNSTAWTAEYAAGSEIVVPLKNQDGQYVADEKTLDELEGEGRVVFRYVDVNPNGSRRDIAGITNAAGNVVGLMPHPEHAVEAGYGPDSSAFGPVGVRGGTDGLGMFTSVLKKIVGAN
ncbi:phosphoribosylformylglycinamidine synthase subunit PurQ [Arthrobacter sp. I2-34]|uniref:Phosphoribosylformylglycinamidine synthase subunit PurQ n=1 Tax=Arthrobacter hankyongi TaxID=2904801 RepID=A0ABS9L9I3_9MICC|nr:phosphoribosylformylglycinamidine synthase subunit PurQ [Arthrobacter hankyongi]MCG2623342.1 phosphoribosylformylglycinamidine synthase subunit PurQ [Arthrobacter hankyongi]